MNKSVASLFAAALSVALLSTACNKEKAQTTSSALTPPGALPPETVVATFGTQKVTAGQLEERIKDSSTKLEEQYQKQRYQMRKQALEGYVVEQLVQAEAKKQGKTEEQYIKAEVDDKVAPPTDEQIKQLFDGAQAQGRLPPGASLEQMKPQIVDFLARPQKEEKARALFEELKKTANVQLLLPEPPRPAAERKTVEAVGPARGPENAPITIVEFSDFECPYCSRAHDTVEQVMQAYAGKVRLVFRHFPLEFHKSAPKAAEASLCAQEQGKFWEFHDELFKNQQQLDAESLKKYAGAVGLDSAKFTQCLDSGKNSEVVKKDMAAGQKVGVTGTPAFFINGIMLSGAQPIDEFKSIIDAELKAQK